LPFPAAPSYAIILAFDPKPLPPGKVTGMGQADELAIELLRRGGPLWIKAGGGSMLPFLRGGDVALVVPHAVMKVGVGDVICYETSPGRLFLHRVIARDGDRFVAKGDALTVNEPVAPPQLLGKVVALERRGKVKRLDTRAARWRNRAIAGVSPLIPVFVALAVPVRRVVRAALRG
jgi:signal peptidase S26 family